MKKKSQLEILGFGGRTELPVHDFFERRGRPREWFVLMYQPIASVYFRSLATSSFLSII